jgi:hypothetical protein
MVRKERTMRLINADALIEILKRNKHFFIDAWGGSFHAMSEKDKARCDEIDNCIAETLNAPTIEPTGDLISRQDAIDILDDFEADIELGERDSYKRYREKLLSFPSAPSAEAEQVTGKLKNPCDSLLTADSEACKEQKSKLDLISRQAAVECVGWGDSVTAVISRIKLLPNVQPDQQRGEWIEVEVFPEVYDIDGVKTWGSEMQCDQCGFRHTAIEGHMTQYNFCPSCGADMRGDTE